jgi:hypothetical protein
MAGYEALGGGFVWVIVGGHGPLPGDDRLARVGLGTNKVSVIQLHHSATSIAFGYGSAWIGTYTSGGFGGFSGGHNWLEAIRAGNRKPTKVLLQSAVKWGPTSIAVGEGAVWVLAPPTLFEVDPQTLRILHRLDLSTQGAGSVAVGAGAVWATGGIAGTGESVSKIDPRTDTIIRSTPLANQTRVTCGIAATRKAVWVTLGDTHCDTIGS